MLENTRLGIGNFIPLADRGQDSLTLSQIHRYPGYIPDQIVTGGQHGAPDGPVGLVGLGEPSFDAADMLGAPDGGHCRRITRGETGFPRANEAVGLGTEFRV